MIRYRAFAEAVKQKNSAKAAELMGYSRSDFIRLMTAFEEEMGFPLLITQGDYVEPTENGARILPYCEKIFDIRDQLNKEAEEIRAGRADVIRIGTPNSMLVGFVSGLIARFTKQHKNIDLSIHEDTLANVAQQIHDNSVDVAFLTKEFSGDTNFHPLFEDEICLAVNKENPLAKEDKLMVHDLKDVPLIYSPPGWDDITRIITGRLPFRPNIRCYSASDMAALAMVRSDLGVYVISSLQKTILPEDVVIRPFQENFVRTVGISVRSRKTLTETQKAFVDMSIEDFVAAE